MNLTNNSTWVMTVNGTTPEWTVLPICLLLIFLTGIIGNGFLLVIFLTHRALWSPFNVYVVNLLIGNCVYIAMQFPFDIYNNLYGGQWQLGNSVCTYYIAVSWCVQPIVFNSHQLIAVNRIWAVTHPISYRRLHSMRTAVALSVGVWVYVLIGFAPGVIKDTLFFRMPVDGPDGCQLNVSAQFEWALTVGIIFNMWPQILMLLALVIIFVARRTRHYRIRSNRRVNAVGPENIAAFAEGNDTITRRRTHSSGGNAIVLSSRSMSQPQTVDVPDSDQKVGGENAAPDQERSPVDQQPVHRRRSHGDLLLILLTISVTICWTPNNIWLGWLFYGPIDSPIFTATATILLALEATIDPLMFAFALGKLRIVVSNLWSRVNILKLNSRVYGI
ncbi:hypothetical protein BV898_15016 [Hypsibius exemplaris]|uniref:G-protein coupled receptors family 1 profile domain-containing protein n=1 Tax=Hypsibius exemplaris TaxID=2072580 RepID=A0A9X6NC58_HYPEX|nr:hypothetical protein BV898_15016 [Hypsibius exemplaris]